MASLINRRNILESRPMGTSTALSGTTIEQGNPNGGLSSAGKQYRELESSYGRALRLLKRAARRGDQNAALKEVAVREAAISGGFSPAGIPKDGERNLRFANMAAGQGTAADALSRAAAVNQAGAARMREADAMPPPAAPEPVEQVGYTPSEGNKTLLDPVETVAPRKRKWYEKGQGVMESAIGLGRKVFGF